MCLSNAMSNIYSSNLQRAYLLYGNIAIHINMIHLHQNSSTDEKICIFNDLSLSCSFKLKVLQRQMI